MYINIVLSPIRVNAVVRHFMNYVPYYDEHLLDRM